MIYEKIRLKDYYPLNSEATITSYCIDNHGEYPYEVKRKTILVIPGGGYTFVSKREAEPIAIRFLAKNYNVFVLDYSVGEFVFPYPLVEAYAAISYIRKHAEKYHIDPRFVGVVGFSAGGHLAASISNYQDDPYYAEYLKDDVKDHKIDFTILSYPVISMNKDITHLETASRISQNDEGLLDYFSIEKHVSPSFPPTFIWTTKEDSIVDYHHSVIFKNALDVKHIKNALFLYEHGDHGGATCDELSCSKEDIERFDKAKYWIDEVSKFINQL